VVNKVSSGSSSPVASTGSSIQFWVQKSSVRGHKQKLGPPMTSGPNLPSFPVSFMDALHASVAVPAHLIWSCWTTVCLSFHTETMFGMIQPSSQATDWSRGARGTRARAEARAGARGGSQTRGSRS
jgi:hypothetical protein